MTEGIPLVQSVILHQVPEAASLTLSADSAVCLAMSSSVFSFSTRRTSSWQKDGVVSTDRSAVGQAPVNKLILGAIVPGNMQLEPST
jgi:hypothetical protein